MNPSEISNDIGNDIGNDSNVNLQEQETESYAQQNIILPSGDKEDATQIYNLDYYTSQSIIENNLNFSNEINDRIDNNDDKPWKRASKDPSLIQRGSELFIGNISSETSEEDLFNLFAECGEIIDVKSLINNFR